MNYQFVRMAGNLWHSSDHKEIDSEPFIDLTRTERDNHETILRRLKEIVDNENVNAALRLQQPSTVVSIPISTNNTLIDAGPSTA